MFALCWCQVSACREIGVKKESVTWWDIKQQVKYRTTPHLHPELIRSHHIYKNDS